MDYKEQSVFVVLGLVRTFMDYKELLIGLFALSYKNVYGL